MESRRKYSGTQKTVKLMNHTNLFFTQTNTLQMSQMEKYKNIYQQQTQNNFFNMK